MKFSKVNLHAISLGLTVESEFTIWMNVVALSLASSDHSPILTSVYGQRAKGSLPGYVKIAEVGTGVTCVYKWSFLSSPNCKTSGASFQRELRSRRSDDTPFGFVFLSEFYNCSATRYRSYSNLARIELKDLIYELQRTHRNLNSADKCPDIFPVVSPVTRNKRSRS